MKGVEKVLVFAVLAIFFPFTSARRDDKPTPPGPRHDTQKFVDYILAQLISPEHGRKVVISGLGRTLKTLP